MANIFDEFQCLKKVRFFNVEKNKNAPFFGMYSSVNLKKVRFFVIFEEKVLQDEYCHMLMIFSWTTFLTNIEKKRTFFKFTLVNTSKKGAFLFLKILKKRTFSFSVIFCSKHVLV